MKKTSTKGFTLIEMLVVIAIIAILTGIIVSSLAGSKAKARDAKRVSDMGNLQLALELYFDRCNEYPLAVGTAVGPGGTQNDCKRTKSGSSDYYSMSDFIGSIPSPTPEAGQTTGYDYVTNSGNTDYVLHARLESPNQALQDGMASLPSSGSWSGVVWPPNMNCSNSGTAVNGFYDYCLGPK